MGVFAYQPRVNLQSWCCHAKWLRLTCHIWVTSNEAAKFQNGAKSFFMMFVLAPCRASTHQPTFYQVSGAYLPSLGFGGCRSATLGRVSTTCLVPSCRMQYACGIPRYSLSLPDVQITWPHTDAQVSDS
eukprot:489183-Rhodomonas_salina.3